MKRKLKINLLLQIVIAIGLGIGCGYVVPEWLGRLFATFNAVFSQLLGFLIPLIILGFVASAIADIGRSAGKMLVATAAIAYVATVCSGLLSFAVGDTVSRISSYRRHFPPGFPAAATSRRSSQ